LKVPANRPGRPKAKRPALPDVPEHTSQPAKAESPPPKETPQDEAIRKMLEAAYT
jgi:hypothetical protein